MLTRRHVLKALGLASYLALFNPGNAMAQIFFKPKDKRAPRVVPNRFIEKENTLVGVSGAGTPYDMIKDALSLIGGLERLGLKGKSVLVKPNVVSGEPHPATTNPEVVGAVVKILYEHGAKKVYVGDMSALMTLSTMRNMKRCGVKKAAEDAGAEVVVFEDHGWVEVELPGNRYVKTAYVTEWLYKTDVFVNLPVIKTHRSASYTITLKNFIGCTHLKQRPYIVDSSHWEEIIAEFNAAYSPDLNIVDGTVSMIEGGPWEGTPAKTNLIIASGDRVAADITGLGVIKSFAKWEPVASKDVWEQRQIKTALELGLGAGKDSIRLLSGKGDSEFDGLIKKIRAITGLQPK